MISQTSLFAYKSIKELGDKQQVVYEAVKYLGRATNEQIADYLGWTINRVTGRCTELRNFNLLAVDGLGKTKSNRSAKVWVIKTIDEDRIFERLREH